MISRKPINIPKQPKFVSWESLEEIPDEFWNGWWRRKDTNEFWKFDSDWTVDDYGLIRLFDGHEYNPSVNPTKGEWKPCGKEV